MNSNLAENLKKIRKENNLSQEDLADILGVSRQAISKWESKVSYPEMDKIVLLCKKFNLNIDDLLHKDIKEVKETMAVKIKIKDQTEKIRKQREEIEAKVEDKKREIIQKVNENVNKKNK